MELSAAVNERPSENAVAAFRRPFTGKAKFLLIFFRKLDYNVGLGAFAPSIYHCPKASQS